MWEYSHEEEEEEEEEKEEKNNWKTNGFLDGYRRQAKFVRM